VKKKMSQYPSGRGGGEKEEEISCKLTGGGGRRSLPEKKVPWIILQENKENVMWRIGMGGLKELLRGEK